MICLSRKKECRLRRVNSILYSRDDNNNINNDQRNTMVINQMMIPIKVKI